jgi:hypothetical protein
VPSPLTFLLDTNIFVTLEPYGPVSSPVRLDDLESGLRAPQSFQYLPASRLEKLLATTVARPARAQRRLLRPAFIV